MNMKAAVRVGFVLFLMVFFANVSQAQYSGNIQGIVTDASGAAVSGATVGLRNVDTGVTASDTTGDAGNYRFSALPPGNYIVSVAKSGFKTTEVSLTLSTAQLEGINITLPISSVSSNVSVVAEAAALDTDETRMQATLSSRRFAIFPRLNRNLWDIMSVTPGVVGTGIARSRRVARRWRRQFRHANAANQRQRPQLHGQCGLRGRHERDEPSPEWQHHFRADSRRGAGNRPCRRTPGMLRTAWVAPLLMQVTTKSGTNQYHGTGSLFYTNQDLRATPDFSGTKTSVSPFARKDLVGALGGPIVKNKTFFLRTWRNCGQRRRNLSKH